MLNALIDQREIRHGHLFCGIGGGAKGFNRGKARVGNMVGKYRCVGGIDVDAAACRDFERQVRARATCLDLFSLGQYRAFHGKEPPPGWEEATPFDVAEAFDARPHIVFLSAPCLPANGPVITETGVRSINSVRVGEKVLTHLGRMREVTHVGTHRYVGTMHGFRLNGTVDVQEFTDEHPIWVRRVVRRGVGKKRNLGPASFIPAKDVRVGDRVGFPIEVERVGAAAAFVRGMGDPREVIKGGRSTARHAKSEHVAVLDRIVDLRSKSDSVDLWFLLGCYLGDGYRRHDGRHSVSFCTGSRSNKVTLLVMSSLTKLGLSFWVDDSAGDGNVKVVADGKHLHAICGAFGDGAPNKSIPPALFGLEDALFDALLDGYRATDGCEESPRVGRNGSILQARWKIPSVSLQLLRDFQRLLLRQGVFASIHVCWRGGPQTIMGRVVQTRPRWELNVRLDPVKRTVFEFADGAVWTRVRAIARRPADEMVWNLSVSDDDTFCAPMMATHNCKGFSGLLSEKASRTAKYQALNELTLRGVDLLLRAYADDPVELFIFENVPRIATRGRSLVDEIKARFRRSGYAAEESFHDCGELGNLGQSRKRFLLVARHVEKIPAFLRQPDKHGLRSVGAVLDEIPLPLSGLGGPMHRMPALQWQTWVRLAFVRAGEDWRSLNDLAVEGGVLRDFGIVPGSGFNGSYGVRGWADPAATVTSNGRPASGPHSVADPRLEETTFRGMKVNGWGGTAGAVTTQRSPGSSAQSVADPRLGEATPRAHCLGVLPWEEPSGGVNGQTLPSNGRFSVADPRPPEGGHGGKYRVSRLDEPSGTVIAGSTTGNGAFAVADVRVDGHERSVQLGVRPWGDAGPTVTGNMAAGAGVNAVADPRCIWGEGSHSSKMAVRPWGGAARTVTGSDRVGSGAQCVSDPRLQGRRPFNNVFRIVSWDQHAVAVAGPGGAGGPAVADPRTGYGGSTHHNVLRVTPFDGHVGAISSANHPSGGAGCVADPRPACLKKPGEHFEAGGHYGVVRFDDHAGAVSASANHDNGFNSVADPRGMGPDSGDDGRAPLPALRERLVCVIVARDGTWHRPFTTLELAALQGLVDPGEMFELDGLSDSAWRERIGNCVPPPSAEAIAGVMGETLLLAWSGETFTLSSSPIWVRNIAAALSVRPQEIPGE